MRRTEILFGETIVERFGQVGAGVIAGRVEHELRQRLLELRTPNLQERRLRSRPATGRFLREHFQDDGFESEQLDFRGGKAAPERRLVRRDSSSFQKPAFQAAYVRDAGSLVAEKEFRIGPALPFLADEAFHGDANFLQDHFVDFVTAVEGRDRAYADARCLHVDEEKRDAVLLLARIARAAEKEHPVRVLGKSDPSFVPIDNVVIAFEHGARLQRGQVRACARLGIALAPPIVTRKDARQIMLLLLIASEGHDHRPHHAKTETNQVRRRRCPELLLEEISL